MMPILETGSNARARQAGFTITEILIVLALIGLAARAVVLVLPNDSRALRQEVETFAARLNAAQDVAIFSNAQVFGVVDSLGYRFENHRGGEWRPVKIEVLKPASWSEKTQVLLADGGRTRIALGALGSLTPTDFRFTRGDARLRLLLDFDGTIEIARD